MKLSLNWLLEWVNPKLDQQQLSDVLTMAGLEVESFDPVAAEFSDVVVGEIIATEKHPNADKLTLCKVNIGASEPLDIVCGASNARAGIKIPVARIGAKLPGLTIKPAKLRGVASSGMLCSATELGLASESDGLLELPQDAPIGSCIREYLQLNDVIADISLTPNRGDCLSVQGLSRELAALTHTPINPLEFHHAAQASDRTFVVQIAAPEACPRYVGRVVENINIAAETPMWMRERLRRSGIRSINIAVDITNYVMLELGQPMHAFDLDKISQGIHVRFANAGESIALLDGSEKKLTAETLVIADTKDALAIAGVMGGTSSSVTDQTKNIFLESAFFKPEIVARQRQYHQLNSDSAYRFERGVDWQLQAKAMERASALLVLLAGGECGPLMQVVSEKNLPQPTPILLTAVHLHAVLGVEIATADVSRILQALGCDVKNADAGWHVLPPAHRFDIAIAEDLIEEVARLHGYDNLPTVALAATLDAGQNLHENQDQLIRAALITQGFSEIISYSFIEPTLQHMLDPEQVALPLLNPMSAEMAVMRTNLWPGLIATCQYNLSRQQRRMRLFEIGRCFKQQDGLQQVRQVAGLMTGDVTALQWGQAARACDFYDAKGVVENLLQATLGVTAQIDYQPTAHPALHPGQSAAVCYQSEVIGYIGALHPQVQQALHIEQKIFLFSINERILNTVMPTVLHEISKFPEIRRDLALIVDQAVPSAKIQATIRKIVGDWLTDVFVFDVYQGKNIAAGCKSLAIGMHLQHPTRTLVDDEVAETMQRIIVGLKEEYGAELRS